MRSVAVVSAAALWLVSAHHVSAFSASTQQNEAATMARLILSQSLSSPSGKLTLSPEIVIPEPTDPTALLLQSTEVTKLSEKIRSKAKANAALLAGSVNALRTFCVEQESARGNFPGPVPVLALSDGTECDAGVLADIADAGAVGIVLPVNGGEAIDSISDISDEEGILKTNFAAALEAGLHPLPEVCLAGGENVESKWDEEQVTALVEAIAAECGGVDPVGILLTVDMPESSDIDDNDDDDEGDGDSSSSEDEEEEEEQAIPLPQVPKALAKRVPILGSVRAVAGGGRMGQWTRSLKTAGFTGAFLRQECVPGLTSTITDLEAVSGFWSAAIGDLKSVKSKSFGFRANMKGIDESMKLPNEWYKYQKSVMESGALGDISGDQGAVELDSDNGDYQGF
mmetsp:Transcript_30262/g.70857  ORF Transcript_30262/g.70857 Transcript_30262/m.70857 type:complete len:398 (-) Transcript_30262:1354-2547(-)